VREADGGLIFKQIILKCTPGAIWVTQRTHFVLQDRVGKLGIFKLRIIVEKY